MSVKEIIFSRCRAKRPGTGQSSDANHTYSACPGMQAEVIRRTSLPGGTIVASVRCTTCGQQYSIP